MKLYFDIDIFRTDPTGLHRYSSEILQYLIKHYDVAPISFSGDVPLEFQKTIEDTFGLDFAKSPKHFISALGLRVPIRYAYLTNQYRKWQLRYKRSGAVGDKVVRELLRACKSIANTLARWRSVEFTDEQTPVIFTPYPNVPAIYQVKQALIVQMLHDIIPMRSCRSPSYTEHFKRVYESALKADLVLTNSNFTRDDFLDYSGRDEMSRVAVTELAVARHIRKVDCEQTISNIKEKYAIGADCDYIISLSTLDLRKNHMGLLRAWNQIYPQITGRPIKLVFAGGKGMDQSFDLTLTDEAAQEESVILTGYVDDADLGALYSGALFSVYPSFYEGFGLPVLESMSCGKFCLASNATSLPEVVGPDLPMVDPHSVDDIATQMLHLIKEPQQLARYHKIAYQNSKRFCWEETGRKTVEAIHTALADRAATDT